MGEWKDGVTLFLTCQVWRQAAENVAESLRRGRRVIATGRLRQRSYETTEGEKRTVHEPRSMSPAYRSATPQPRSPGPAVPATVSPRTPARPPAATATSRRSDAGLSRRISKPPISSTPLCNPAPASARNPLTTKRHSIWRTSSRRAVSSRLDPGRQPVKACPAERPGLPTQAGTRMLGESGSGEDCRASAILARAQRRDVRPNICASRRSDSGLPACTLSRYAATAASLPSAGLKRLIVTLSAGADG
jgi:single-stranded DNA-binding protein